MEAADVLERAAEFLETVGWVQNQSLMTDAIGVITGACVSGACWIAATGASVEEDLHVPSVKELNQPGSPLYAAWAALEQKQIDPMGWNDTVGRTAAEVIDLLKEIAKDLRNNTEVAV
jgi:hypothetical protein